ncbi:hypothetical protein [Bradyrhizobium archetypum]|uniref:Uncharacterized protein n=1 Tax=Bradyrhizobium archetypum TaxID=2721160 RepID=A0A7Y4M5H3_9BRAD|nr:hypothetical protein [Bradyrhizobium archetypum]NOJ50100.1 hypothetical protein [Bradyrhizobium archetypum]
MPAHESTAASNCTVCDVEPVSDADGHGDWQRWSLLLIDRHAPEGPVAYHYHYPAGAPTTASQEPSQKGCTTTWSKAGWPSTRTVMIGVYIVDDTRELVKRLVVGLLRLDSLVADRQALQQRLGADPSLG